MPSPFKFKGVAHRAAAALYRATGPALSPLIVVLRRFTAHAVGRNILSLYGIQAASYIVPLLTYPYIGRVLGVALFGRITWAQAFITYFLVVTEYGFNLTVTREVSLHRDDMDKVCRIYTSAMATRALLMTLSFGVMMCAVAAIPKLRSDWPLYFISFLTVVGSALFPQWLFQGLEKMEYISIREVGARVIGLMTLFFLVRTRADYLWAAGIMSGSTAVAGLIGLLYVRKLTGVRFTRTSWAEIRQTLADGWHIFVSTGAITLYTRSNTFILGLIASEAEVGAYTAAARIVEPFKSLVVPLSTAIFPHISRVAAGSREAGVAFIQRNTLRLAVPFVLISLGLLVGSAIGIPLFYGKGYGDSIRLMQIMSPIPLIVALGTTYATYFMLGMGYKKQWANMIIMAGAFNFLVLVPLLFVTGPSTAVSITAVVTEGFVLVCSYLFYRRNRDTVSEA